MTGTFKGGPLDPNTPDNVARDGASHRVSNITTALVSLVALAFSGFSLWETSLKQADLSVFVPPVIHFAQPYNNTNFEVIEVPVTMVNDGARSGTVLGLSLAVTDPRSKATKLFYAADLGRWTMEQTRASAYKPFAPISVPGNASRTETVLFYTRGDEQKPNELIREPGSYRFELTLEQAEAGASPAWMEKLWPARPASVVFERALKNYDARAFNTATLPLYAPDWSTASNVPAQ
jgi:hypothetical protein